MLDILDFPYMYTNHIGCVTFSSIEILRILPLLPSLDPTPFSDSRACLELGIMSLPESNSAKREWRSLPLPLTVQVLGEKGW